MAYPNSHERPAPNTGMGTGFGNEKNDSQEKKPGAAQEIKEVAESLVLKGNRVEKIQRAGGLMVETLIKLQRGVDNSDRKSIGEAAKQALEVQHFIRGVVEPLQKRGETWHMIANGFLAEVATGVFAEQAGFEVKLPSQEEDMKGKIDQWWGDPNQGKLYAVQVKASKDMKGITLTRANTAKAREGYGVPKQYRRSIDAMRRYVSKADRFNGIDVEYLVIELAAGELNDDPAFNVRSGVLSDKADRSLNNQLYAKVWNE